MAFEKMMGDMVEANVTAWKLATKTLHDFEDSLDKEDKEGVETPAVVTIEEGAEGTRTFTEGERLFLEKDQGSFGGRFYLHRHRSHRDCLRDHQEARAVWEVPPALQEDELCR